MDINTLKTALTFDDVSLVPQYSTVKSRHDVDLSCGQHFGFSMTTPILSANMRTVTGTEMCKAISEAGGVGVLHRFDDDYMGQIDRLNGDEINFIPSVGVDDYVEILKYYNDVGIKNICIDVAHGHHSKMRSICNHIADNYNFTIIAGNVCTVSGARFLASLGVEVIKVGVGPGSHCTTRVVTGHGVPQLTAILEIRDNLPNVGIIADGGIRNSGDIAKALAAGADYVMIGRLLAGCEEAPSEAVLRPNGLKKIYRGSASYEAQAARRDKRTIIAEGVQSEIPYTGAVGDVIKKLSNGIKSACSYTGAYNLKEFRRSAQFVKISPASFIEGTPHGMG